MKRDLWTIKTLSRKQVTKTTQLQTHAIFFGKRKEDSELPRAQRVEPRAMEKNYWEIVGMSSDPGTFFRFFFFFQLKDNWFTILCWFLPYTNMTRDFRYLPRWISELLWISDPSALLPPTFLNRSILAVILRLSHHWMLGMWMADNLSL